MSRILKIALGVLVLFGILRLVTPRPELINRSGFSQAVYDRNGRLLRLSLASDERYRLFTPIAEISPHLRAAALKIEDRWFYFHPGVNPISLFRAAYSTFIGRERRYGASTITMQLARLRFGLDTTSISGKSAQILRALQLELFYSKREILEAYLNLAPYGGNIEGAGAAALIYFGKEAKALNFPESLTLSVIPQNPAKRRPGAAKSELLTARNRTLEALDPERLQELSTVAVRLRKNDLPFLAPHFVDRVIRLDNFEPRLDTTLDLDVQSSMERLLSSYLDRNRRLGINNAAMMLLDSRTMETLAYVGSADYFNKDIQGFVDGVRGKRSPGSALKPFLYGLGLDQGVIHPESVLKDIQFSRASYDPENFDGEFLGPISASDALVRSRNSPAVSLLNRLRPESMHSLLKLGGVTNLKPDGFYGLSMALGGVDLTLEELMRLYAALARGGEAFPIKFLKSENNGPGVRLLSPEASELVLRMLAHNPRPGREEDPTGRAGAFLVPWKTGTSFGFKDAWALGFVGPYVLGAWIGNFDSRTNPSFIGRDAAGPLFFSAVDALIAAGLGREPRWTPRKLNISSIKVCAVSGELPGPFCHHLKSADFIPGVSPIKTCSVHRQIEISPISGLRTCSESTGGVKEIFEFWPSDIQALFRRAGFPRRLPPAYEPGCVGSARYRSMPEIISPRNGVSYIAQFLDAGKIPFSAALPADSKRVFWFVNGAAVGSANAGETIFWDAKPGTHVVSAVDEQGRSVSTRLSVRVGEDSGIRD